MKSGKLYDGVIILFKRVPPEKRRGGGLAANGLKTGLLLLAASLLCEGLYQLGVGEQNSIIVMVLAVFIIAAVTDGYQYGILATLAGVFIYDFLVTQPRLGFSFTMGFPITLSIMLLVTLATSTITTKIKKQAKTAREQERRAALLYSINRSLLFAQSIDDIARDAIEYLRDDLHRSTALVVQGEGLGVPRFYFRQVPDDAPAGFFTAAPEWAAAQLAVRQGLPTGAGTATPAGAAGYYHPVSTGGTVYGVFGVSCPGGPLSGSQMDFLTLLAGQTAQALRAKALAAQQQRATLLAESEKSRSRFLRGISHDLRTPLTSMLGASATLLESRDALPAATQTHLIKGIHDDAQWLLSMVENILSVTRMQDANMVIQKTEEAAEEVVAGAVSVFRKRFPDAVISIHQADALLLVPMDALLITQVITNLLDNSQRHAAGQNARVSIEMLERDGCAAFIVTDTGPGIAADVLPHLFAIKPARAGRGADASRGLGIGLSICKTIIEAHGGHIEAANTPQGGARFCFTLPLGREVPHGE